MDAATSETGRGRGRLRLEYVDPETLTANPGNWRHHPKRQVAALERAIYGSGDSTGVDWAGALLFNERTGRLIDGHARRDLAAKRKDPAPVLIGSWSEAEEKRILLTLDPIGGLAEIDIEALKALASEFPDDALSIFDDQILAGSGVDQTVDAAPKFDQVEALLRKFHVERGQVWELGSHRLMCGDSMSSADVENLTAGAQGDLLATDPPYCVNYTGADRPKHGSKTAGKDWSEVYREVDIEDLGVMLADLFAAWLPRCNESAPVYVWHGHTQQPLILKAFEDAGLLFHQVIIWDKPSATLGHSYYRWKHEPCAFGWRRGHRPKHGSGQMESVWSCDWEGKSRVVGNMHPTQKPYRLFEIPMEQHTKRGATVFEPFSGSGTQILAAERLGRRCLAMEIVPAFVAVALDRWSEATGQSPKLCKLDG